MGDEGEEEGKEEEEEVEVEEEEEEEEEEERAFTMPTISRTHGTHSLFISTEALHPGCTSNFDGSLNFSAWVTETRDIKEIYVPYKMLGHARLAVEGLAIRNPICRSQPRNITAHPDNPPGPLIC
ncbi:hypothetical protein HZH66_014595 [Vespula vulgaris]|uniref:Uncharacterized protein n=1 Tax=Vespula vulgaris TaxID=7454 RepID=A0A834MPP1_VESVU|nr:hypothetical protein HZH66_014595 [Vespula vulgaris]